MAKEPISREQEYDQRVPLVSRLAWLLDNLFRIPGVGKRIGLDPLLGLIPGGGDLVTGALGTLAIGVAIKKRAPKSVVVRMTANTLLNALVGTIPMVGDLFSLWFKSNSRNQHLLTSALDDKQDVNDEAGWFPVVFLCGLLLAVVGSIIIGIWLLLWLLWKAFT